MGIPIAENSIKMDGLGVPRFMETSIYQTANCEMAREYQNHGDKEILQ